MTINYKEMQNDSKKTQNDHTKKIEYKEIKNDKKRYINYRNTLHIN